MHSTAAVSTKSMATTALMTAVICVLGPLSVVLPVSPVPIAVNPLPVYLAAYILGRKQGTISVLLYLLLGVAGLPVFSGYSGGFGKLLGPTGGYLISYIFIALICGWFTEHFHQRAMQAAGLLLSLLVCYAFGTAWLAHLTDMTFTAALGAAVFPFIPGDILKIVIVLIIGPEIHRRLIQAGVQGA